MTPQEKAIELVKKYDCGGLETFAGHSVKKIAKQCAIIAVEELIKEEILWLEETGGGEEQYWEQVKTEIETL